MRTPFIAILLTASLITNVLFVVEYLRTAPPDNESASEETTATAPKVPFTDGATVPFIRVVDGDTVMVGLGNRSEYVRLIGINAPEPNISGEPECYALESTDYAKKLFSVGTVQLYADPSQASRDTYNRILAYITLPDGTDAGEAIVRAGFAREYMYDTAYTHRARYLQAEEEARENKTGLWSPEGCQNE